MEARYKFLDEKRQHLHTLDGKPLIGTSTVLSIVSKPLTWWAAGKAVEQFGWIKKLDGRKASKEEIEANRIAREEAAGKFLDSIGVGHKGPGIGIEEWMKLCDAAYRAHDAAKNQAADKGTDMHAELETYVRSCMAYWGKPQAAFGDNPPAVITFAAWAIENVQRFLWSELHCWSESLWLGGISDCGALLKDGRICIIDFKSSKEAYASQFWQIAGYDLQLSENGGYLANGERVFLYDGVPAPVGRIPYSCADVYFIIPFGAEKPEPVPFADVEGAREAFKCALGLYKANQAFNAQNNG